VWMQLSKAAEAASMRIVPASYAWICRAPLPRNSETSPPAGTIRSSSNSEPARGRREVLSNVRATQRAINLRIEEGSVLGIARASRTNAPSEKCGKAPRCHAGREERTLKANPPAHPAGPTKTFIRSSAGPWVSFAQLPRTSICLLRFSGGTLL
jgi:hypothetical protein